jgi:nitrate reductase NapAB chaperone NapD
MRSDELQDDSVVSGVVILTRPGCAAAVAGRLATVPDLAVAGDDGDARIAAVWSAADGEWLEALGEELVALDEDVLGVFTTFAGRLPRAAEEMETS